ncbi:Protein NEN3 [Cardamine amara subsp. amara]|uniref:Protein NEN3 n=1 Tax=Cardamine amara subsp. amara TaxID=228776 RepID=A0ABD1ANA7_CARAN
MGSDKYVFFDFKVDSNGILEFGGIFVSSETLEYISQISSYVQTTRDSNDSPTPIWYRRGLTFLTIYGRVYRLLHGKIWIGHDIINSDVPRLIAACAEIGEAPPQPKYIIDTLDFLKSDTKLARLAERFGFGDPKHGSYKACEMNLNAIKQSWVAMSLLCEQEDKEKNYVDKIHPILSLFLKSDTTRRFSELDIGREKEQGTNAAAGIECGGENSK